MFPNTLSLRRVPKNGESHTHDVPFFIVEAPDVEISPTPHRLRNVFLKFYQVPCPYHAKQLPHSAFRAVS